MRIVFLGSGRFGCASLRWLSGSSHDILQVITQPARPAGRGKKLVATPIAQLTHELNIPCIESPNVNDPDSVAGITDLAPDVLLVIAFGQKIGDRLLNLPNCRAINLHGSLLPRYRGAAPINWAIINGEKQTGLTVIELNENWDAGDILGRASTDIRPGETAGELHDRLAQMGPDLLDNVLTSLSQGSYETIVQDKSQASRAPKLNKADGAICWDMPAEQVHNHIHGTWPWPGAYCYLQQNNKPQPERVSIARVRLADQTPTTPDTANKTARPGTLDDDLCVACNPGRVELLELRPQNGRLMSFADFVNGRRLQSCDLFLNG